MEAQTHPLVYAVILDNNRCQDTLECLLSLSQANYPNLKILVLDNASTDGTREAIHENYPQVQLFELDENKGYAGNNNIGIEIALCHQAEWIFILNDDLTLAPDCISELVAAGNSNSKIGVVGPMVFHHTEPDVIQSAGGYLDQYWRPKHFGANEIDSNQFDRIREVDWISGCAILVRREALEKAGLMDERFFLYNEEVDLCYRIKMSGWSIVHVPAAKLWHKGVRLDYQPSPNVTYYTVRNFFLFLDKNHAPLRARLHAWARTIATILSFTLRPKWRHKKAHRDAMVQGLRDYLAGQWGMRKG
ncbi:MAG TPA: glycosyltransferase family 2 protein [Anaerolineaceae bacterium]|nr:glycosyltransferase family 2 protein [Anaerolineaceae bacterium]